jgi:hypothetical protein
MSWRGGTDVMEALIDAIKDLEIEQRRAIYRKMIAALTDRDWSEPMVFIGVDPAYDLAYKDLGLDQD